MNSSERPLQFPRDKDFIKDANTEDYTRLFADLQEMKIELKSGKLSPLAKGDLEKQISQTQQALTILRESLKALSKEDSLVLTDELSPLEIEITDKENFYHDQHLEKLRELEELEKERELLFDLLSSEKLSPALEKIEVRIREAKKAAEAAYEQYLHFQNNN